MKASVGDKDFVTKNNGKFMYQDARAAILGYRQDDYDRTLSGCCDRFRELKGCLIQLNI